MTKHQHRAFFELASASSRSTGGKSVPLNIRKPATTTEQSYLCVLICVTIRSLVNGSFDSKKMFTSIFFGYQSPCTGLLTLVHDSYTLVHAFLLVDTSVLEETAENKKSSKIVMFHSQGSRVNRSQGLKKRKKKYSRIQAWSQRNAMALRPALIL